MPLHHTVGHALRRMAASWPGPFHRPPGLEGLDWGMNSQTVLERAAPGLVQRSGDTIMIQGILMRHVCVRSFLFEDDKLIYTPCMFFHLTPREREKLLHRLEGRLSRYFPHRGEATGGRAYYDDTIHAVLFWGDNPHSLAVHYNDRALWLEGEAQQALDGVNNVVQGTASLDTMGLEQTGGTERE